MRAAVKLGYVPNATARSLIKKLNTIIGLIIPDIMNPFFSQIAKGVEECARSHNFSVFLCNTNLDLDMEKSYIRQLYSYNVAGLIILPISEDFFSFTQRYFNLKNIVLLSYKPRIKNVNYVLTDDNKIIDTALLYLMENGHRKITYIGGGENIAISDNRFRRFMTVMGKKKLRPLFLTGKRKNYLNDTIDELRGDLAKAAKLPTAFICYNDKLALDLLAALDDRGIRVPEEASVIGVDDTFVSGLPNIKLTTIRQRQKEMGVRAAEIIITNATETRDIYHHEVFDPELVVRRTVRDIAGR